MTGETSIALLPLDNRPVSYLLPKQISDFSNINLIMPERKYLGDLNTFSDSTHLQQWFSQIDENYPLVISLDNWIYGGLIQSRKHSLKLDDLKNRVNTIKNLKVKNKYGFSSILRIANYNNNEEEKEYWKQYGEQIFKWSEYTHKVGRGIQEEGVSNEELLEKWYQVSKLIPAEILADYKGLREKNLSINLLWLDLIHNNCFKYLIFSCDDSGKYGMNVVEAEYLSKQIKTHNFSKLAKVVSGTDEVPLILLTKAMIDRAGIKPTISVYFNSNAGKNQIARYESKSIYSSIINQIEVLSLELKEPEKADIVLYTHVSDSVQGDHIFCREPENTKKNAGNMIMLLEKNTKPFIIIDLAYANGADPNLINALINADINWNNCYGYAGWNTCSNSSGTALAIGINRWIAEKKNVYNKKKFKECLLVRLLDDYAYQTQIRHKHVTEEEINEKIKSYKQTFSKLLEINDINIKCKLPWGRSFEVEIDCNMSLLGEDKAIY